MSDKDKLVVPKLEKPARPPEVDAPPLVVTTENYKSKADFEALLKRKK